MPSKKKKYNARFPAGRIKKIMQSDEEVGKVAQAVPVIMTLELFVESLLTKTLKITNSRNAKTLSTSHMKQCIMSEQRFDFLRELVKNIPDISVAEEAANYNEEDNQSSPEEPYPDSDTPYDLSMPSTSLRATRQQQQQVPSNGHNNGGHTHQQLQQQHQQLHQHHHDYQRNYLKRSMSSNPNTVIRHTTSVAQANVECLPAKLSRSESTPVPPPQLSSSSSPSSLTSSTSPSSIQHHPRLKHQSYSMPSSNNNNNNSNDNNFKPNINNNPPKQLRSPPQQTAIPAPIVSIDYCSKPVVKIDYSNLPFAGGPTTMTGAAGPLSAPANIASMSDNNTAFNFSAEPVINIDLSNIVAGASIQTSSSSKPLVPNVATISIGTPSLGAATPPILPLPPPVSSSSFNKIKPFSAIAVDQQSRNSKAIMAEPFNSSSTKSKTNSLSSLNPNAFAAAAPTTMTTKISTTNSSDSYLDMDEDYDNI